MKINGNEVRPGHIIQHNDSLWVAVKISAVKPGKGGAFAQVELKNIETGSKLNQRFRATESVERVRLDQKDHQFLFSDGETLTFMDTENYEQIELSKDFVGEGAAYLQDGMVIRLNMHEGRALGIDLPEQVTLAITETEPTVKGQTATSSFKPAILENGVRVMVPPFVGVGERIVVQTEDSKYLRRAD